MCELDRAGKNQKLFLDILQNSMTFHGSLARDLRTLVLVPVLMSLCTNASLSLIFPCDLSFPFWPLFLFLSLCTNVRVSFLFSCDLGFPFRPLFLFLFSCTNASLSLLCLCDISFPFRPLFLFLFSYTNASWGLLCPCDLSFPFQPLLLFLSLCTNASWGIICAGYIVSDYRTKWVTNPVMLEMHTCTNNDAIGGFFCSALGQLWHAQITTRLVVFFAVRLASCSMKWATKLPCLALWGHHGLWPRTSWRVKAATCE